MDRARLGSGVVERARDVWEGEGVRSEEEGVRREGLTPLPVLETEERRVRGGDLEEK